MKKVSRVIDRFDCSEALPSLPKGFGNAISFVPAHEIDVNPGSHRWAQPSKQASNPGNICVIAGWVRPVCEKIEDEGRTAIAEGGFARRNPSCCAAKVVKLNFVRNRGIRSERLHHGADAFVAQRLEVS